MTEKEAAIYNAIDNCCVCKDEEEYCETCLADIERLSTVENSGGAE